MGPSVYMGRPTYSLPKDCRLDELINITNNFDPRVDFPGVMIELEDYRAARELLEYVHNGDEDMTLKDYFVSLVEDEKGKDLVRKFLGEE